jgi:hypothetical protein
MRLFETFAYREHIRYKHFVQSHKPVMRSAIG